MKMISITLAIASIAVSITLPAEAIAQGKYPSRPVTIVVTFGPGSASDIGVRQLVGKMQPRFDKPLLVETRPGAGTTIGAAYVAKAKPDGHIIMFGSTSSLGTAPGMVKGLTYDPVRDFSGITMVGEQYFALLTRGEVRDVTFPQFLERMRKNPENYPVAGQSASYQTLNKLMTDAARLNHTYVPYVEAGRMLNDLWGGRLGGAMVSLNMAVPLVKSGQGHIVAVSSTERLSALPNTPTMQETLAGVYINSWTGYFAPAKTPRPVIGTLHALISGALRDPEILKRNEEAGRALFTTPEETDAYVKKEVPRWMALLKAAGIGPE